jgi:hypothetical protein
MSILDEIRIQVEKGNLFEVKQRDLRPSNYRRSIYVSSEMERERTHRIDELSFRQWSAQAQAFINGATIPVALQRPHKKAEWARLDPAGWEVWEMRVRFVEPELRVLGRFADQDIFVVMHPYEWKDVKGKWKAAKLRCQEEWSKLFPGTSPVFGRTIHDYIRTNITII